MEIRCGRWVLFFALGLGACSTTRSVAPKDIQVPDASIYAQVPVSKNAPQGVAAAVQSRQLAPKPKAALPPRFDPETTIFFRPQSTELAPEAMGILRRLADRLKANRLMSVVLIGHTDDLGGNEYCLARASKLTSAVSTVLEDLDVRPTQIRELPKGSVASQYPGCTSDECRRLLRRVELQVSGS